MYFYKAYGLSIASEIELPELVFEAFEGAPDLTIRKAHVDLPELQSTKIFRRGIRAEFGEDDKGNLFLTWDGVANFAARKGQELLIWPQTADNSLISLFTISEALGLILFQRGYFLIHASAVCVGDMGWCFLGDPGAGKSTSAAAFVKHGCTLLSDDLTAMYFKDGRAYILPAYPQLKIWDNTVAGLEYAEHQVKPLSEGVNKFSHAPEELFKNEPVELAHIFFIEADASQNLEKLSAFEAPTELLRHFPLAINLLTKSYLKKHFSDSLEFYKVSSLWKKRREESFESLENWVKNSIEYLSPVKQV